MPSFEEHRVSDLPARRHRRSGFLSSHWTGLQSSTHVPGTVLVWCTHPALRFIGPSRRLTVSSTLRGLQLASCGSAWSTHSRHSLALRRASRVSPDPRACDLLHRCGTSTTADTGVLSTPSHGVLRLYDAFGQRQRPAPGLPHPAVLRLQAFSTS
jgi:hypothetical protein